MTFFDFYLSRIPSRCFFFNDTATTEIYTLSLHDALPISSARRCRARRPGRGPRRARRRAAGDRGPSPDRKSTRLNSSHSQISYAVFCLTKKAEDFHRWPELRRVTHKDQQRRRGERRETAC